MENVPKQSPAALMMLWGVLWLVATLGGSIALLLLNGDHRGAGFFIVAAGLALHFSASLMIVHLDARCGERTDSKQLTSWLIFGGWALMICVFFAGCVLSFSRDPF
jgi:hypothetical protein